MKTYLLFGFLGDDIHAARQAIENALGIAMMLHESGYRCGEYYRCGDVGSEHFILQKNFDVEEGEWTEPGFRDCGLLLYANETARGDEITTALGPTFRLLVRQELE